MSDRTISLTEKQTDAFLHLTSQSDIGICYGGGKGGGKSFLLCFWVEYWVDWLIQFFELKPSKHPPALGFIGRKRAVDFNDTTLETWKRIVPGDKYVLRTQEKEIVINDTAKIAYGGLDDTLTINKFNSAEYAFEAIDQAEETNREDVSVLEASLRLTIDGKRPPYKRFYSANPAECWLKDDYIINPADDRIFIPALPDDNPYLPDNYKDTLRNAFAYDPALLRAYLEGDWDAFANLEDALVQITWVNHCRKNSLKEAEGNDIKILSCDVATKHGSNMTVLLYRYGSTIKEIMIYQGIPVTQTATHIKRFARAKEIDSIVIDSDGVGEGLGDILDSERIPHIQFHGGYAQRALDDRKYRNLRSQFYSVLSKKLEKGLIDLTLLEQKKFEDLRRQLCTIKVKKPDGLARFQIESKDDLRGRGVTSPDLADALMMSEYAFFCGKLGDIKPYAAF